MNQKNGQNSLGLDNCFGDEANPINLFKNWFSVAEKSEINDPNALSLATSTSDGIPSVRMVLFSIPILTVKKGTISKKIQMHLCVFTGKVLEDK